MGPRPAGMSSQLDPAQAPSSQERIPGTPSDLSMRWRSRFDALVEKGLAAAELEEDIDALLGLETALDDEGMVWHGERSTR